VKDGFVEKILRIYKSL